MSRRHGLVALPVLDFVDFVPDVERRVFRSARVYLCLERHLRNVSRVKNKEIYGACCRGFWVCLTER